MVLSLIPLPFLFDNGVVHWITNHNKTKKIKS